jgi:hypothetical protein
MEYEHLQYVDTDAELKMTGIGTILDSADTKSWTLWLQKY